MIGHCERCRDLAPCLAIRGSWVALSVLAAIAAFAARSTGGESGIRAADLKRNVEFLASDALEGRDTGTPGVARAEEYVAAEFRRYGLAPLPGQASLFVEFPLYRASYDAERTKLELDPGGEVRRARAGLDFRPFPFSDDGTIEGEVVFAGYGISAPDRRYDDYAELDVAGKLVLVLRHEPREEDRESPFDKARTAREHGAIGMLLVTDPVHHGRSDDLRLGGSFSLEPRGAKSKGEGPTPFVAAQISRELAEALVLRGGRTLDALRRETDGGVRAAERSALGGVRAHLSVYPAEEQLVWARDVAGFLPGRDPELRREWIVVGGHHDHVGRYRGEGDTVFNGADDNASGTAGVLELAEAFSTFRERPRRSLVFVTFSGEEHGLLGSRALVSQGAIPMDRVSFMVNLDMIGRNPERPIDVIGDGYARGLREVVEAANSEAQLDLAFAGAAYAGNSDHDSFYEADVPFVFLFTGVHEDYHQVGDHADKLDYGRMQRIVRVAYRVVTSVADADRRLRFVHHVGWLGAEVEVEDGESPQAPSMARVTGVEEGSRAAAAGLRAGDAIVAFGDRPLAEPERVGEGFRGIEPGSRAELGIRRAGQRFSITVERAKTGYLGLAPGAVDDDVRKAHGLREGQGIAIRGVVPDGPADRAGLRAGDLLVGIDGKPVGLDDLAARLSQIGAGERVRVQLRRGGESIDLVLTLGERPERR